MRFAALVCGSLTVASVSGAPHSLYRRMIAAPKAAEPTTSWRDYLPNIRWFSPGKKTVQSASANEKRLTFAKGSIEEAELTTATHKLEAYQKAFLLNEEKTLLDFKVYGVKNPGADKQPVWEGSVNYLEGTITIRPNPKMHEGENTPIPREEQAGTEDLLAVLAGNAAKQGSPINKITVKNNKASSLTTEGETTWHNGGYGTINNYETRLLLRGHPDEEAIGLPLERLVKNYEGLLGNRKLESQMTITPATPREGEKTPDFGPLREFDAEYVLTRNPKEVRYDIG